MSKKKIVSLFLIFALLLGMFNIGGSKSYADQGTDIKLTLSPATEGRYDYYTYEEAIVYLDLDLSGYETNIENSDLVITVPKEYLNAMVGSSIGSATGPTAVTTEDGQYQLTYHFSKLTGGTTLRIPIRVQTKSGTTPENYVLPINARLVSSGQTDLAVASELDLKQITRDPIITKYKTVSGSNNANNGTTTYGGQGTATDSNIIQPGTENPQVFGFWVSYENVTNTTITNYLGVRKYEQIIIRDTLTDGAVFVQSLNPGWTYDAATNTATYVINNPSLQAGSTGNVGFNAPSLSLIYPNGDIRNTYSNTASVEFVPQNKQTYEGPNVISTDGITFKMTTTIPSTVNQTKSSSNFADQITQKTANKVWTCSSTNPSDSFNLENLVYEDSNLDPRLGYSSIRLAAFGTNFSGTVNIEAVDATGTVTTIAQNVSGGSTEYAIPAGTVKVYVKSTTGSYLLPSKTFTFYVTTKLKDPENVHYDGTTTANNRFQNTLKTTGSYVGTSSTAAGTTTSSIYITPYTPSVYLLKSTSKTSLFVGEATTFTLRGYANNTMMAPDTIQDSSVIDLLPQGLEYVAETTTTSNNALFVSKEPTVVANYKGTGQTALIWTFANPLQPASAYYTISYQAKATKNMTQGVNTNKAYWIWDNNGSGSEGQQVTVGYTTSNYRSVDIYDFDNDGNVSEYVAYSGVNVTYVPPREVIASKYTRGSLDLEDTLSGGRTEIGDAFSYTLKVWNNSISDVNQLTAIEVLPYVGDKTLVSDSEGQYLPRNSAFQVNLTGPLIGPAGFTVYYSTQIPTSDSASSPSDYAAGSGWMPEAMVSDWSTIRGIKIVMDSGTILKVDTQVKFYLPVKSPADMSLVHGEMAHNSFAISVNGGKDFLEANSVGITLTSYKVTGTLFDDSNQNGQMDDGEGVFANQEVQLFNEDGTPAVDLDGNPIKTTTEADGTYQLDVYNKGTYFVKVTPPDYYLTTTKGDDDNKLASHVSTTTGKTDLFELTADASLVVRNGGYYANSGDLTIKKVLLDSEGNSIDESREFTIRVTGPSYPDGKEMTLTNKTPLVLEHLEFGTYDVEELNADIYEVSISGTVTLSFENQEGEITVQNKEKTVESTSLDIKKIVKGNPNLKETFAFRLTPEKDTFPMPDGSKASAEVTIEDSGDASFGTWSYTKPGDYTYQVKEVAGSNSHYTYDQTVYTITDSVILNDDGDLEVSRSVQDDSESAVEGTLNFTNKFTAKPVETPKLGVSKKVVGNPSKDETFIFEMRPLVLPDGYNGPGSTVQTVSIVGDGTTSFDSWTYTTPGRYSYEIREIKGNHARYTYDDTVYIMTDQVEMNDAGELIIMRGFTEAGEPVDGFLPFENHFTAKTVEAPMIAIQKTVTGNPSKDETFTFQLTPDEDNFPAPTDKEVIIKGSGTGSFDTWDYTKVGTYTYQVKEVAGSNSHYTYDQTVYTITDAVTLNDAGDLEVSRSVQNSNGDIIDGKLAFTNKYADSKTNHATTPHNPDGNLAVQTGDNSHPYILLTVASVSLILALFLGWFWRRRNDQK